MEKPRLQKKSGNTKKVFLISGVLSVLVLFFGLFRVFYLEQYIDSVVYFYFGLISFAFVFYMRIIQSIEQPIKLIYSILIISFVLYAVIGWFYPISLKISGKWMLIALFVLTWSLANFLLNPSIYYKWIFQLIPILGGFSLCLGLTFPQSANAYFISTVSLLILQSIRFIWIAFMPKKYIR